MIRALVKTGFKILCTGTEAQFQPFVDALLLVLVAYHLLLRKLADRIVQRKTCLKKYIENIYLHSFIHLHALPHSFTLVIERTPNLLVTPCKLLTTHPNMNNQYFLILHMRIVE